MIISRAAQHNPTIDVFMDASSFEYREAAFKEKKQIGTKLNYVNFIQMGAIIVWAIAMQTQSAIPATLDRFVLS